MEPGTAKTLLDKVQDSIDETTAELRRVRKALSDALAAKDRETVTELNKQLTSLNKQYELLLQEKHDLTHAQQPTAQQPAPDEEFIRETEKRTKDARERYSYKGTQIYERYAASVFYVSKVRSTDHTGTAFLCYANGSFALFMTCWHVSTGIDNIEVTIKSPKNEDVVIIGRVLDSHERQDIAVIVVKYDGMSDAAKAIITKTKIPDMASYYHMGQPVWVLSYDQPDKGIQLNNGIITGVEIGRYERYSTNAIVSAGHSGAPVFDKRCRVVGMAVESELGPERLSSDIVKPADLMTMKHRAIEKITGLHVDYVGYIM